MAPIVEAQRIETSRSACLIPGSPSGGRLAGVFFFGALLVFRGVARERQGQDGKKRLIETEVGSHRQTALAAFAVIFIAEWGT